MTHIHDCTGPNMTCECGYSVDKRRKPQDVIDDLLSCADEIDGGKEDVQGYADELYAMGYRDGLADQSGSGVLQAVLDAIKGTLDTSSEIADHPNVKFAQMQRLKLLRGEVK